MRIDKYLTDMGAGTRTEIKKAVRKGQVTVNGRVVSDPGLPYEGGIVFFKGTPFLYEPFAYYMLNKPSGVISATEDRRQKTVLDLIDEPKRRDLFPVGRLDRDTEGLLLVTNDGDLAHRLLSPKKHVDKTYFARVRGLVAAEHRKAFAEGLSVDESFTAMPSEIQLLRTEENENQTELTITIREGKYHQIKRMFASIGMEVLYLKRLRMGPLVLDPSLPPGSYRRLTEEEIRQLKKANFEKGQD